MPKAKRVVITTTEDNAVNTAAALEEEPIEAPIEHTAEDEIGEICNQLEGTSATVTAKRRPPKGLNFELVERLNVSDFSTSGIEELIRKYGGGTYQLVFHNENKQYVRSLQISVDPRLKGELDQPTNGAPQENGRNIELLTQKLGEKGNETSQLFLQMMQMQREHSAQMMTLLASVLKPSPVAPAPAPKSVLKELAELAPLVAPLMDFLKGSRSGTKETLELLATAKGIVGEGGGGDSGLMDKIMTALQPLIVAKVAGGLAPAAMAQPAAEPVRAAVTAGQPQAALLAPGQGASAEMSMEDPEMIKRLVIERLRQLYPDMAKHAAKGTNVDAYFEVWAVDLESQAPFVLDTLLAVLSQPNWVELCFGQATVPNLPWFERLRALVLRDFAAEDEPGTATGEEGDRTPPAAASPPAAPAPVASVATEPGKPKKTR